MHLPFTPNHILLVAACYPAAAALVAPNADCKPNGPELSRLTYYAANRPGKITKLAAELEKRTVTDARKAKAANQRSRATLLVTLAIFKALVIECRRELALLSSPLIASVAVTLSLLDTDVEIVARTASLFAAWATYTDGHLIGVDARLTDDYMSTLKCFGRLSSMELKIQDEEHRNRLRLIGLGAITATVASEALYGTSSQFRMQVDVIVDSILSTTHFSELPELEEGVSDVKEKPSPNSSSFRERPVAERRAPSIYGHVDGQEGPKHKDVVIACLRALSTLLSQSNASQIGAIMQASFESLDQRGGWDKPVHCTWFAQCLIEWSTYQYRYAVPTLLIEHLLEIQDTPTATPGQHALMDMITTVFTSPAPLVNLSTSDTISNLVSFLFHRVAINPDDELLAATVECIAALGTHVYYADQIQDLATELIGRMQTVEAHGVPGRQGAADHSRSQALRCLILGLVGLIQVADKQQYTHDGLIRADSLSTPRIPDSKPTLGKHATAASEATLMPSRPSRRAKIEPDVWQDTLTLLCDGTYAARADYADALIVYLRTELTKDGEATDSDGVRRVHSLSAGPIEQANSINAALFGDAAKRFLNALHGYLYILATARSLGHNMNGTRTSSRASPNSSSSTDEPVPNSGDDNESAEFRRESRGQSTAVAPRSRKTSMTQRILQNTSTGPAPAATASDYAHLLAILTTVHDQLPLRGLLTGIPMLIALTEEARSGASNGMDTRRSRAIEEVVTRTWRVVGRVWDCTAVVEAADKALATLSTYSYIPDLPAPEEGAYHVAREPIEFLSEPAQHDSIALDTSSLLAALAASASAQDATGLDEEALLTRLWRPWTPELAFNESVEPDPTAVSSDATSGLKVAPALMHIENLSLANLNRPSRGVGVTELREALSGRNSMSNTALPNRAPSVSTLEHGSSLLAEGLALTPTRSRGQKKINGNPNEVRDVLNKLGIGKQTSNGLLKAPFNTGKSPQKKVSSTFSPPYRT